MNSQNIDFSPLKKVKSVFQLSTNIRNIQAFLVRLAIIIPLVTLVFFLIFPTSLGGESYCETIGDTTTCRYSCDGSECGWTMALFPLFFVIFNIGPLVFISAASLMIMFFMNSSIAKFASLNGFRVKKSYLDNKDIAPSFKSKSFSWAFDMVEGRVGEMSFGLLARVYKDKGILGIFGFKSHKMDTIMKVDLPGSLPQIVVNARRDESLKRSNLSADFDDSMKFRFEGVNGEHYDAYAAKTDRVTALQIFTPDVLEVFYDKFPTTDVEIQGSSMWLIERHTILDDEVAKRLFEASSQLYDQVSKQVSVATWAQN